MSDATNEPIVRFEPDRQRFVIEVGGVQAGLCQYREEGDQWIFVHTVIDEEFEGQGLASRLARAALDGAREHGKRIVAECSFIRGYLAKHDDWNDIVDPV